MSPRSNAGSPRNNAFSPRHMPGSPRSNHGSMPGSPTNYFDHGMEKHKTAAQFEFAFNGALHNPIVNPIGDPLPMPGPGMGLHRGKGSDQLRLAGARVVN